MQILLEVLLINLIKEFINIKCELASGRKYISDKYNPMNWSIGKRHLKLLVQVSKHLEVRDHLWDT